MSRRTKPRSKDIRKARETKRNPHMVLRLNKRRRVYCDPLMPAGWEPQQEQMGLDV